MNKATCFDSKESPLSYPMNHNIDITSDNAHFGIPKRLHRKIRIKLLQNCLSIIIDNNFSQIIDKNFIKI